MSGIKLNRILLFMLLFTISGKVTAQPDTVHHSYLKSYFTDSRDLLLAPFTWKPNDISLAVFTAGYTAFFIVFDDDIHDLSLRNGSRAGHETASYALAPFGNGIYSLPLLGFVYANGTLMQNEYDKQMALLGLKTFVISAGEATLVKALVRRSRPDESGGSGSNFSGGGGFKPFSDNGSFVSRHATTAFALAAVLSKGFGQKKRWVTPVAYTLASLVALSRVYENEHWFSDVFAGACLGYATGSFVFHLNKPRLNRISKN